MSSAPNETIDSPRIAGRALAVASVAALAAAVLFTPIGVILGGEPRRAAQVSLQVTFLLALAAMTKGSLAERARTTGLLGPGNPWKRWIAGFLVGALGLAFVTTALWIAGERHSQHPKNPLLTAIKCLKYVPLAPLIGVLEDVLFFGLLYEALSRRLAPTAFIYAWSHFIHIDPNAAFSNAAWKNGFEALPLMGRALGDVIHRPIEMIGLFIVGGVLAALRRETRTLYFGAGVHGGWYFWRSAGRKFSEDNAGQNDRLFGTDLFYDGLAGWLLLVATGVLCGLWFRRRLRTEINESSESAS